MTPAKARSALQSPLTDAPLSQEFVTERDVLMVPWGLNKPKPSQRSGGFFRADGSYLSQSESLRFHNAAVTVQPEYDPADPVETLSGRYLYGGLLYAHFGHFLCESTARLWALARLQGLDGVIWVPKPFMGHPHRLTRDFKPFFEILGFGGLKLVSPQKNTRVEEVVFAEQGFGLGKLSAGRPEYRDFMRQRLGGNIAADGPEKLYISRAALPTKRGSVLLERKIESLMQAEGYEIFYPEQHGLEVQIARYKAAKVLVGLDGSAFHLAAMIASPDIKVAMINRGPSQNINDYLRQFEAFSAVMPLKIEEIQAYWFTEGQRVVKRETHAELNFPAVGRALFDAGLISAKEWPVTAPSEIAAEISQREERGGQKLQRYEMELSL